MYTYVYVCTYTLNAIQETRAKELIMVVRRKKLDAVK